MPATKVSSPKERKSVVPPAKISPDMSVFDYLRKCQPPVDKKIIDIACSQMLVPGDLQKDAAQEISLMWSQMKPDTKKYKPGQIAAYAHSMARHAALRLRRELGSSVRLPGSAFRKRKDGSSYVTPGVLASALDWNDMESWYQTTDEPDSAQVKGPGADALGIVFATDEEPVSEEDFEAAQRAEREDTLRANHDILTTRQRELIRALVDGATFEEVMKEHGIKKGVLMRELTIASSVLGPLNF